MGPEAEEEEEEFGVKQCVSLRWMRNIIKKKNTTTVIVTQGEVNYYISVIITYYYILSSNKGIFVWPIWPEVNCPYFHIPGK